MILSCFLFLTFLFSYFFLRAKKNDLFSPISFISLKNIIFNLPFLLFIYFKPEEFQEDVLRVCDTSLENAVLWYTVLKTISFLSVIFGVSFFFKSGVKIEYKPSEDRLLAVKFVGRVFFLIGLLSFLYFLSNIGGIEVLLMNLSSRVELQSGQSSLFFLPFLSLSVLTFLLVYKRTNKKSDFLILVSAIVISFFVFSSLGGRKNTLYLFIMIIVGYNYVFKRLKIREIKKRYVMVFSLFIAFYILIIPILRRPNGVEEFFSSETDLVEMFGVKDLVYSISYTYIDIFAANYFEIDNLWYFRGIQDIPKNIFGASDKSKLPPIDDGIYFRTITMYGTYVRPSTPRGEMATSSWPIENFGFSYANFHILGIIIFFFLQGGVFSYFYKKLLNSKMIVVSVFLYVFVIFNFNFSNLRLVQFVLTLPIIMLSYLLFKFFKANKRNY